MNLNYFLITTQSISDISEQLQQLFLGYVISWIIKPLELNKIINYIANGFFENLDRNVNNGYGEFIAFHRNEDGKKIPLNQSEFQKFYQIINDYTPDKLTSEEYANRHITLSLRIKKEISEDCDIAFCPRTLYELILIKKCLEEEKSIKNECSVHQLNKMILKERKTVIETDKEINFGWTQVSKKNIEIELKKNKCWHRCYFNDGGNNQHPNVIKIAYKIHKEILKNPLFQSYDDMTFKLLKKYTEEELKNIRSYASGNFIKNDNIIFNALKLECSELAKKVIFLYRGSKLKEDECYNKTDSSIPYSLSYASGLFAGYLYESGVNGAMAFNYMSTMENDAYAIAISIDEYFSSSFFIPQTNTICQFAGFGETFHARTKAWQNQKILQGFQQAPDKIDHLFSTIQQADLVEDFHFHKKQAIIL